MLVVVGALIAMAEDRIPALNILHSLSLSPDIILYIFFCPPLYLNRHSI